nr:unnamed protein product [Digitaria exilis]
MASANPAAEAEEARQRDELAESLAELFANVSVMVRGELQEMAIISVLKAYGGVLILVGGRHLLFGSRGMSEGSIAGGDGLLLTREGTNNQLALLEKMNDRVAQEYSNYGDVAAGLRVFVEQLNEKNRGFDEYVSQIDAIDQQVTEFEAVVSMLDKHVALLEKKVKSAYQISSSTQ